MGAGYSYIDQAMHEQYTWQILILLGALKIVTTGLSFSSGTPGGLFAPTLFMGAMIGGAVGMAEHQIVPNLAIPVGSYALIGMGTLFAGILRAPMTSVFMIMEVSGNYSIIVPVILSNAIAYFISRTFQPTPIFDLLSRQDGLDLPSLEEERELPLLRVEDAMRPPAGPDSYGQDDPEGSARTRPRFGAGIFCGGNGRRRLVGYQPDKSAGDVRQIPKPRFKSAACTSFPTCIQIIRWTRLCA